MDMTKWLRSARVRCESVLLAALVLRRFFGRWARGDSWASVESTLKELRFPPQSGRFCDWRHGFRVCSGKGIVDSVVPMKTNPLAILILIAVFVFSSGSARATVQARDSIKIDGEDGLLDEFPIGSCERIKGHKFGMTSTANYSGVLCNWEVVDGRLFLTKFRANVIAPNRLAGLFISEGIKDLKWLFPKSDGPVFADWYSGTLTVGLGETRMVKMMGHIVVTDALAILEVEKGVVKKKRILRFPGNIPAINEKESKFLGRRIDVRKLED